ncbi:unnamed protein product [Schistosoma rodhaini]|uniref:Uncharacterized protein n=1 Tax=Schistosoma rodhaini TaxID=6188 RepID=A0AA85GCB6_9TREM|nr:unnamed protein product [Schistosoma rodhaini]
MSYSFDLHESIYGSEPYNTTHFKIPSNQTTTTATTTKHKQNGYVKQFLQQNGMRKTKKSSPLISVNGTGGGIGEQRFDANFKVLLLGNSGVGKTSIIRALVGETFYQTTISTIGIDLIKRIFTVENHRVQLEVWDTAGQEQYHSIVSLHFREAKDQKSVKVIWDNYGSLILFSLTNSFTDDHLKINQLKSVYFSDYG